MAEKSCEVPDCISPIHAKGWCRKHYAQVHRHGKVLSAEEEETRRTRKNSAKGDPIVDRINSAKRELERVAQTYDAATGQARMEWGKKKSDLEIEIALLEEQHGVDERPSRQVKRSFPRRSNTARPTRRAV